MARTRNPEPAHPTERSAPQHRQHAANARVTGSVSVALPDPLRLYRGGVLHGVRMAYETWGRLSPAGDNAILLFTGLSPSAHAAATDADPTPGWWERMIGPDLALDSSRYFIVCVNSLGSCFGSTGPASIDPATGQRYGTSFPEIAVEDIAKAAWEAMRALGIERLAAVVGASLGGMSVLAFAAQFPLAARRLISISGSAAASPFAIALRSVQREAILRDPDWQGGHYAPERPPRTGMRLARKLGTITYRSAAELRQRFGREPLAGVAGNVGPFAPRFAVEGYLEAQAERFTRIFDPNCYLYLSSAMDRFDLAEHGGSFAAALRTVASESVLVIGVESDMLFPIDEQAAIAEAFERNAVPTRFARLSSLEGHDAFLLDIAHFGGEIRSFLG
ncbi:MAG: homoserine O-acetyltransferase [Steroidobacteraceae bacterium]